MRHIYFLFQIISFKKYFYVSLGTNFFTVFVEAPLVVEALGNCPVCPPLKSGPESSNSKWVARQTCGGVDGGIGGGETLRRDTVIADEDHAHHVLRGRHRRRALPTAVPDTRHTHARTLGQLSLASLRGR